MRQAAVAVNRGVKLSTKSLPAPVGGWNARDSIGEMPETDAVTMENWFPGTTEVYLRKGQQDHVTGITGQVESLIPYSGGATNKLFAAAVDSIYDVSNSGTVGSAVVDSLTNGRFQYTNVSTSGGNFLLLVNGADKLQGYDGSAWWVDADGTHDISGFDTSKAVDILLHKNRVWMVENNTLSVWYLGTSSIAGAATEFPLQSIARKGGYIMAMGTWTIDAGYGVDDLIVFVTNKGEVIVYNGTDPDDPDAWSLVGVWAIGSPIGRRCLQKYSGDLLIICQDGVYPMSGALQSSRTNPKVAITDKIQQAISQAVSDSGDHFGWELIHYPRENQLYLNVPVYENQLQEQYVMNTITKSWCRFTGMSANCWALYNDNLYFGTNGKVRRGYYSFDDAGSNIVSDCQQAFTYCGTPARIKQWTFSRTIIRSNGSPGIQSFLNIDFEDSTTDESLTFSPPIGAEWDESLWDQATWEAGLIISKFWKSAVGMGYCAAPRLKCASQGLEVHWVSTDIAFKSGGII